MVTRFIDGKRVDMSETEYVKYVNERYTSRMAAEAARPARTDTSHIEGSNHSNGYVGNDPKDAKGGGGLFNGAKSVPSQTSEPVKPNSPYNNSVYRDR